MMQQVESIESLFSYASPMGAEGDEAYFSDYFYEEEWELVSDELGDPAGVRLRFFHFRDLGGIVSSIRLTGVPPDFLPGKKNNHDPAHYGWYVRQAALNIYRRLQAAEIPTEAWLALAVDIDGADYGRWAHREVRQPDEAHAADALELSVHKKLKPHAAPAVLICQQFDDLGLCHLVTHHALSMEQLNAERVAEAHSLFAGEGVSPVETPGLPKGRLFSRRMSLAGSDLHRAGDAALGKLAGQAGGIKRRGMTAIVLHFLDRRQAKAGDVDADAAEQLARSVTGKGLGRKNGDRYASSSKMEACDLYDLMETAGTMKACYDFSAKLATQTSRRRWQRRWRNLAYDMAEEAGRNSLEFVEIRGL